MDNRVCNTFVVLVCDISCNTRPVWHTDAYPKRGNIFPGFQDPYSSIWCCYYILFRSYQIILVIKTNKLTSQPFCCARVRLFTELVSWFSTLITLRSTFLSSFNFTQYYHVFTLLHPTSKYFNKTCMEPWLIFALQYRHVYVIEFLLQTRCLLKIETQHFTRFKLLTVLMGVPHVRNHPKWQNLTFCYEK